MLLVSVAALLGGGACRVGPPLPPPPTAPSPAPAWDADYADVLTAAGPDYRRDVHDSLQARRKMASFRVLREVIAEHGRGARRLVVVEKMPGQGDLQTYWCGAAVETEAGLVCYSSGPLFVAGSYLVGPVPAVTAPADRRAPWSEMWALMNTAGVSGHPPTVFDFAGTHPAPWLVHVTDRTDGSATFALGSIALYQRAVEEGAVIGSVGLDHVPPSATDAGLTEEPRGGGGGDQGDAQSREMFSRSYGARLALNGALRELAAQNPRD
jgi:hypothetical protein